nr:TetR/AcrR family transcriptional regulator [Lachnospiraceae bacterium]
MARRKKELQSVHRKNISMIAEQLFMKKGIENTSMNDIAKASGYSKATLYVYFKNKEELVGILVLESMQKLYD